jgi:hypothetical protein
LRLASISLAKLSIVDEAALAGGAAAGRRSRHGR